MIYQRMFYLKPRKYLKVKVKLRVAMFKFLEVEPPSPRDERGLPFDDDLEWDPEMLQHADLDLLKLQDEPIQADSAYVVGYNIGYRMLQVHRSYFLYHLS